VKVIRWLPHSEIDLDVIWDWVASNDIVAASSLIDRITTAALRLSAFPKSGHQRPDLPPGFRVVNSGHYLVIYMERADSVDIVAVRHGKRRLDDIS
jgi:toxin ParE1/3/4